MAVLRQNVNNATLKASVRFDDADENGLERKKLYLTRVDQRLDQQTSPQVDGYSV